MDGHPSGIGQPRPPRTAGAPADERGAVRCRAAAAGMDAAASFISRTFSRKQTLFGAGWGSASGCWFALLKGWVLIKRLKGTDSIKPPLRPTNTAQTKGHVMATDDGLAGGACAMEYTLFRILACSSHLR